MRLRVIPCVGMEIDPMTPEERYQDLCEQPLSYKITGRDAKKTFDLCTMYHDLQGDREFQAYRKVINDKDHMPVEQFEEQCLNMAQKMRIQTQDLELQKRYNLEQEIRNSQKFDRNLEWKMAARPKFQYKLDSREFLKKS